MIETHTDGTLWVACTKDNPLKNLRVVETPDGKATVYHPDAKEISEDYSVGYDSQYHCPHCDMKWWVERDG